MMPSPDELIALAGAILLIGAIVMALMDVIFCTRPIPRWLRTMRTIALILIGARWLTRQHLDWEPYWFSAIALNLAVWVAVIAAYDLHAAFVLGDRCRDEA